MIALPSMLAGLVVVRTGWRAIVPRRLPQWEDLSEGERARRVAEEIQRIRDLWRGG